MTDERKEIPPACRLCEAIERALEGGEGVARLSTALERVTPEKLVADLQDETLADVTVRLARRYLDGTPRDREVMRPPLKALSDALWRDHRDRRKADLGQYESQAELAMKGGLEF